MKATGNLLATFVAGNATVVACFFLQFIIVYILFGQYPGDEGDLVKVGVNFRQKGRS